MLLPLYDAKLEKLSLIGKSIPHPKRLGEQAKVSFSASLAGSRRRARVTGHRILLAYIACGCAEELVGAWPLI